VSGRTADRGGSLGRTAVLNLVSYGVVVLAALLVTPQVILSLGDARYGAWALVAELVGYSALLDFGIRWAVSYFLSQHLARKEWEEAEGVIGTAAAVLCIVGLIVAAVGGAFAVAFPLLFEVPPDRAGEVRTAIMILTTVLGLSFPFEIVSSILYANRRLDVQSGVDIACSIATAAGFLVVIHAGGGLVALSLVQAASRALGWALRIAAVRRLPDRLRVDPRRATWARARQFLALGGRSFTINIARLFFGRLQSVVIGAAVGLELVTRYRIGASLADYLFSAVGAVSLAFTPHLTHLFATGDREGARRLYLRATRLAGLMATAAPAIVIPLSAAFVSLWVGPQYVSGPLTARSDLVLAVLLVGMVPRFLQSVSWQLITASGDLRFLMWVAVGESAATLALSWLLVTRVGLIGVAAATALPLLVTQLFVVPVYVVRRFGVEPRAYWSDGLARPVAVGVSTFVAASGLVAAIEPRSWPTFAATAAAAGAAALLLAFAIGMLPMDRHQVLARFGGRLPQPEVP
jgi:membrane protein EpsK